VELPLGVGVLVGEAEMLGAPLLLPVLLALAPEDREAVALPLRVLLPVAVAEGVAVLLPVPEAL